MSKVLEVTITKEDDNGVKTTIRVSGPDAEMWGKTVDGWSTFMYVHGQQFPALKWETVS